MLRFNEKQTTGQPDDPNEPRSLDRRVTCSEGLRLKASQDHPDAVALFGDAAKRKNVSIVNLEPCTHTKSNTSEPLNPMVRL